MEKDWGPWYRINLGRSWEGVSREENRKHSPPPFPKAGREGESGKGPSSLSMENAMEMSLVTVLERTAISDHTELAQVQAPRGGSSRPAQLRDACNPLSPSWTFSAKIVRHGRPLLPARSITVTFRRKRLPGGAGFLKWKTNNSLKNEPQIDSEGQIGTHSMEV